MAFRRLSEAVRRFGVPYAVMHFVSRMLERGSGGHCRLVIYRLVAQPVPDRPFLSRPGRIEIREVEAHEIQAGAFPRPEPVIRRRFAQGHTCLGAFREGTMIGYIWLALKGYDEDEVRCRFEPQPSDRCAWDFDVFVFSEHRMGTCFARLWQAANEYLRNRGYRWTMSRISCFNVKSMAAHRRLQAVDLATTVFLVTGPVQATLSTCRPWMHLSVNRQQRPRIVVAEPR